MSSVDKVESKLRRRTRIRGVVSGTADRPRLSVFRSSKHIYAQVINDDLHQTLAATSTLSAALKTAVAESESKVDSAKVVGQAIAKICLERGITKVVFDRGGCPYHGRVKAVAEAAREAGLEF
jgi:large subunit ribosomal protein L18